VRLQLVGSTRDRRRRDDLRHAVEQLATALVRGEVHMSATELEALAQLCAEHFLPVEAARVRRWKAGTVIPEAR